MRENIINRNAADAPIDFVSAATAAAWAGEAPAPSYLLALH